MINFKNISNSRVVKLVSAIFIFILLGFSGVSQSLTPVGISTTGGFQKSDSAKASLSTTIGQPTYTTHNYSLGQKIKFWLTQGFQQPDYHFNLEVIPVDPLCSNEPSVLLQAYPEGGAFYGPGISGDYFVPKLANAGINQIKYVYSINRKQKDSTYFEIEVWQAPTPNLRAEYDSTCVNGFKIELDSIPYKGGIYSGLGVTDGIFNPSQAGIGYHTIYYRATDSTNGCFARDTTYIKVLQKPTLTFDPIGILCTNDSALHLNVSPAGGVFEGDGAHNGYFHPDSVGSGTFRVDYKYELANGCKSTATQFALVDSAPKVSLDINYSACENSTPFFLTGGQPLGGKYIGVGVDTFDRYNASLDTGNTRNIIYRFTNVSGCTSRDTAELTVFQPPQVTLTGIPDICTKDASLSLNQGLPNASSGITGTYSGLGIISNTFYPNLTVPGNYQIQYSYTDSNYCTNTAIDSILVKPSPLLSYSLTNKLCEGLDSISLLDFVTPIGGVYSGANIFGSVYYNSNGANSGSTPILYTYADTNGCTVQDSIPAEVISKPTITFNNPPNVCVNAVPVFLQNASPVGGMYYGTGMDTTNKFNPSIAGIGTHQLTYEYTSIDGCFNSSTANITVDGLPSVDLTLPNFLCLNSPKYQLTTGTPVGGSYSGKGLISNDFYPNLADTGITEISYSFTDANNCSNSISKEIYVRPLPEVSISNDTSICYGSYVNLAASGGIYYQWNNGNKNSVNLVKPTLSSNYQVTVNDGYCQESENVFVNLKPIISTSITSSNANCDRSDGSAIVAASGQSGPYSYRWTSGHLTSLANNLSSGIYEVTTTDINGCSKVDIVTVNDNGAPIIMLNNLKNLDCYDDNNGEIDISVISGTPPYGFNWSNGIKSEDLSNLTASTYDLEITDEAGCKVTASYMITQPEQISLHKQVTESNCNVSTGFIKVNPLGGISPYTYNWSNSTSNDSLSGVSAGYYTVSVSDQNNCEYIEQIEVSDIGAPLAYIDSIGLGLCGNSNTIFVSHLDTGSFNYLWSTGDTTKDLITSDTGSFVLEVSDLSGCKKLLQTNILPIANIQTDWCHVGFDEITEFNKVSWKQKSNETKYFEIWKFSPSDNNFFLLDTANVTGDSLFDYTDQSSIAKERSSTYFVLGKDSCAYISEQGSFQKSIQLAGIAQPGALNINWNPVFATLKDYLIFGKDLQDNWVLIDSVDNSTFIYSDNIDLASRIPVYRIGYRNLLHCGDNVIYSNPISLEYISGVGLTNNELNNLIKIFPNPAIQELNISLPKVGFTFEQIEVLDISGRTYKTFFGETLTQSIISFSVHDFSAGTYIIQIQYDGGVYRQRIVVQ